MEEVFTSTGKQYQVKVGTVILFDLRQALALRSIISSFETSPQRIERGSRCKNKEGNHG